MTAQGAHHANVIIANTTAGPLTVALPKAAVGVHVLPQFNPQFGQGDGISPFGQQGNQFGANNGGGGNQAQGVGGGLQPAGQQATGQGPNANPFGFPSVPAEWVNNPELAEFVGFATIPAGKSIRLAMRTVCLHYGRPEPTVKMTYRLQPVAEFSDSPVLAELLENYSPRTDRDAMQAAAWHVSNVLTWDQVQQLPDRRAPGSGRRYFAQQTVDDARSLVQQAEVAAKTRAEAAHVAQREE
jgi:hypothetical protein